MHRHGVCIRDQSKSLHLRVVCSVNEKVCCGTVKAFTNNPPMLLSANGGGHIYDFSEGENTTHQRWNSSETALRWVVHKFQCQPKTNTLKTLKYYGPTRSFLLSLTIPEYFLLRDTHA